jgi:hypothetical protein
MIQKPNLYTEVRHLVGSSPMLEHMLEHAAAMLEHMLEHCSRIESAMQGAVRADLLLLELACA